MRRLVWVIGLVLVLCGPASARQSVIAPDGSVYVVGQYTELPQYAPFGPPPHVEGLLHATQDGTRVRGFGRDGLVTVHGQHVALLPGGGVAVVDFDKFHSTAQVWRYTADGTLANTTRTVLSLKSVDDVHALSDGRLLLSGMDIPDHGFHLVLVVLQADGSLDPNFGGGVASSAGTLSPPQNGPPEAFGHIVMTDSLGGAPASILGDGRILVGGPHLVARFTPDGRPDSSWGGDGEVTVGDGVGIVTAAGDGAWVLERIDDNHLRVHHLDPTGAEDHAATYAGSRLGLAKDARTLPDGRLAFISWAASDSGQPYIVSADASTLAAGPDADGSSQNDLHLAGDELVTVGPFGSRFRVRRYDASLHRTGDAMMGIVETAPAVKILSGPSRDFGAITGTQAHFRLALEQRPEDLGYGKLMCSFDQEPDHECPTDVTYGRLVEGYASLRVWGVGIHGVPGPAVTYDWQINSQPPRTSIRGRPPRATGSRSARISFRAAEATTRCRIGDAPWRACTSPLRLSGLRPGPHQVQIYATDEAGTNEPRPATVAWRIGPSLTVNAVGTLTLLALHRGHATVRVTNLRTHHTTVHRLALRAFRTRTLRLDGTRLRVSARLPGVRRPLTVVRR